MAGDKETELACGAGKLQSSGSIALSDVEGMRRCAMLAGIAKRASIARRSQIVC